jgi:DNA-binding NarL/FixJ family response regulator
MNTSAAPLQIIVADDHQLITDGFIFMFNDFRNIEVVATASNGEILLALVKKHLPDVVVTDIQMPVMNGIQATGFIKKQYPNIPVIAMTMFDDEYNILNMLKAGAIGFINKTVKKEVIADAIYSAYKGDNYYCRNTGEKLKALITSGRIDPKTYESLDFSAMEFRVIRLICMGLETKEIAEKLNMAVATVNKMRGQIYDKVDAKSTAGVILFAIRTGIYKIENDL